MLEKMLGFSRGDSLDDHIMSGDTALFCSSL